MEDLDADESIIKVNRKKLYDGVYLINVAQNMDHEENHLTISAVTVLSK